MKRRLLSALFLMVMVGSAARGQTISATIDVGRKGEAISPRIYGQFVEHLGGIINTGIWAEMLDDRKFFNAVTSAPPPALAHGGRVNRGFLRRWNPIGPEESVVMDGESPFAGEHSPKIMLAGSAERGVRQAGLSVLEGKRYAGHIWLAGDAGAAVKVSLVWGSKAADREEVSIGKLTAAYANFPLVFTAGATTDGAGLEISGTGTGAFHVGVVSLMPGDNVGGFRGEVVALLRELNSGVYRFPGGNYISNYEWRDAVGGRDRRPPTFDYAWNAVQPNDVGIDEFMVLFKLINVEPYMTVNAGFGDEYSAAQLVQYANGSVNTPMGQWRAMNGHPGPYGIKLWGIGNEMYGEWQLGVMPLKQYEIKHNLFAKAMRAVDPSITLIASGAMPDEMTVTLQGKRIDGKGLTEIGSAADWTGGLLTNCLGSIDMVSEHCYCTAGQGFDVSAGAYVDVKEPVTDWMRRPANRVRAKYEAYEEYLKRIPGLAAKRAPVSVDEYSYRRALPTSFMPAMAYAEQFHELFRHTEVFQMAAFTFATSCLSENRTGAVLNPVGLVFDLYGNHYGRIPVEVEGNSPQPAPRYPVGGDQPAVNAGSATFPLDVAAALSEDGKEITIAVVNPMEKSVPLGLAIKSGAITGAGMLWQIAPGSLSASNVVGQKPQVEIKQTPAEAPNGTLDVAAMSVSIYEFPIR